MNVIGISSKDSGCGYHRILLPLGFMEGIKGYVTNIITDDKIDGWDVLVYNRISPYDFQWPVIREELKCKIVLDLDDYWHLPPNHLNHHNYLTFAPRIENNIREADAITVTNENLASKVRPFNHNVHIVPNGIPFGHNQFTEERRESERVRIFWCGGVTHEHDICSLRNSITRLRQHKDKIQMVMGGINETDPYRPSIWGRMFSAFTLGGTLPYMKIHGTSPVNFMQMYENADIMIIPLEKSDWHACKSNLKILEAATKKIPCIVSNVEPYSSNSDAPVFWVNKQSDWFFHLNNLILNPELRNEYGEKLYQWAKEKYNLADINRKRKEVYQSVIG